VLELARRVTHEVREYDTYPEALPGGVRVRTRDGRVLEEDLPYQRGAAENPMSREEICAKFRANAALGLPEASVEALESAILALEESDGVEMFGLLGESSPRAAAFAI
jgi:2-methylcitrate dehydratase PrpD